MFIIPSMLDIFLEPNWSVSFVVLSISWDSSSGRAFTFLLRSCSSNLTSWNYHEKSKLLGNDKFAQYKIADCKTYMCKQYFCHKMIYMATWRYNTVLSVTKCSWVTVSTNVPVTGLQCVQRALALCTHCRPMIRENIVTYDSLLYTTLYSDIVLGVGDRGFIYHFQLEDNWFSQAGNTILISTSL